jgi:hypothetical protein
VHALSDGPPPCNPLPTINAPLRLEALATGQHKPRWIRTHWHDTAACTTGMAAGVHCHSSPPPALTRTALGALRQAQVYRRCLQYLAPAAALHRMLALLASVVPLLALAAAPAAGVARDAGGSLSAAERRRMTAAHCLVGVLALYLAALGVLQPPPALATLCLSFLSPFMCVWTSALFSSCSRRRRFRLCPGGSSSVWRNWMGNSHGEAFLSHKFS